VGKPSLNAAQPYAKAEGRVLLLVLTYPGCPGTKAVKRLLLLLLLLLMQIDYLCCIRVVVEVLPDKAQVCGNDVDGVPESSPELGFRRRYGGRLHMRIRNVWNRVIIFCIFESE